MGLPIDRGGILVFFREYPRENPDGNRIASSLSNRAAIFVWSEEKETIA